MVWRSPADQPGWARPVLLLIAAVAALLYSWNITSSGYALYYSDAVKSMSVSWKALLFGAMDPGATITPDKIPGSFVPQALSARVFGFHEWSVTLPQVIEGVVCVLVMYRVVRRWAGPKAGIIAAGLFTFTPVVASMFGHSMEDGALTFCLVLAADCYQRAVLDARLRSLVFSGVWVGLGFQAKMMQAWMVLPALAVGYLVAAPAQLRRRVAQLLVAGVVCAAVSLSWVALVTLVPAKDRPYVDGSTDNSAVAMVFGYNGLERFGIHVTGSVPAMGGGRSPARATAGAQGAGPGAVAARGPAGQYAQGGGQYAQGGGGQYASGAGGPSAGAPAANGQNPAPAGGRRGATGGTGNGSSWLKLFQSRFGPQIGWTYPLAVLALALGLWWRRRAPRTDRLRGGFVMWGTWLVVVGLVFSKMSSIPHTAYMATLAPALAALSAGGIVMMWRAYREGGPRAWALPAAVAAEAGWSWYLGSFDAGFLPWLRWLTLAASVIGVAAMVLGRVGAPIRSRLLVGGLLAGLAGAVLTPVAWSASVLDTRYGGSAFDAGAGPSAMGAGPVARVANVGPTGRSAPPGPGGGSPGRTGTGGAASSARPRVVAFAGPGGNVSTKLTGDQSKLYAYVKARRGGAEYVMATDGWTTASPYILATGDTVLPMGGFSGSVPHPTLGDFVSLIHTGQLRYIIVSPSGGGFGRGGNTGSVAQIRAWVQKSCTQVPSADYGVSAASAGAAPAGIFGGGGNDTLYRCSTSS
jgi:4-amino-4-deoxy-L-arabinose transferase-like glycosyltransferase